jgi:SPFH domain/Band 7 family protein
MEAPPRSLARRLASRALEPALVLGLAAALVAYGTWRRTGDTGVARVADDEVAVVVDRVAGTSRVEASPGRILFRPLLEKVHVLDRSPRSLRMEGSRSVGDERVPQLIARAKDGSSFRLSSVEVQYALLPGAAALALEDSGVSGSLRAKLLAAAARSVLRDELGRVTAEEIVRGACGPEVGAAATVRLNAMLAPHGVEVLGVVLGKPGFDEEYEEAIRRRAAFAQETERLDADLARISADRPRKVAATAREKELELASLEGVLAVDRGVARSQGIRVRQEADDFYRSEVEIGTATRKEKEERAALQRERYTAAAREVYREGVELEKQGDLAVRAALVQKLAGIQFEVAPHDPPASARVMGGKP